jgi:hypothetical protein
LCLRRCHLEPAGINHVQQGEGLKKKEDQRKDGVVVVVVWTGRDEEDEPQLR